MSKNSKIEWCDHTQNFWEGCQRMGPGCDHCYAEARNKRFGGGVAPNFGPGAPRRRTAPKTWGNPRTWNKEHDTFFAEHGRRQKVFCASLSDWADNAVPIEWLVDALDVIRLTPNLDWMMLTKRIGLVISRLEAALLAVNPETHRDLWLWIKGLVTGEDVPHNVWVGATVVDQNEADRDIPKLRQVPAIKRFLSMEPLLGLVDLCKPLGLIRVGLDQHLLPNHYPDIDLVIVGGESGHGARPMHPAWPRSLRDQCDAAKVPFLFKQLGEWRPLLLEECRSGNTTLVSVDPNRQTGAGYHLRHQYEGMLTEQAYSWQCPVLKVGKAAAGRLLDGREWNGTPT